LPPPKPSTDAINILGKMIIKWLLCQQVNYANAMLHARHVMVQKEIKQNALHAPLIQHLNTRIWMDKLLEPVPLKLLPKKELPELMTLPKKELPELMTT
jgi:hypothetical protein